MFKFIIFFYFALFFSNSYSGEVLTRVACDTNDLKNYNTSNCNECFIGSALYAGVTYSLDYAITNNSKDNMYHIPGQYSVTLDNLQSGKVLFVYPKSEDFAYSSGSLSILFDYPSLNSKLFKIKPGQSVKIFETRAPLSISAVTNKATPNFGLKINYELSYYSAPSGKEPILSNQFKQNTNACVFYPIRFCGDGFIDPRFNEKCDPKNTSNVESGNSVCSNTCQLGN